MKVKLTGIFEPENYNKDLGLKKEYLYKPLVIDLSKVELFHEYPLDGNIRTMLETANSYVSVDMSFIVFERVYKRYLKGLGEEIIEL